MADSTAFHAVCPRPQIEASRIAWPTSRSSAMSPAAAGAGPLDDPVQRLLLPYGADPARHALAAGLVAEELRDAQQDAGAAARVSSKASTTPEPSVVPGLPGALEGERDVQLVGAYETAGRAAEQDRPQLAPRTPGERRAVRRAWRRRAARRRRGGRTLPETQNSLGPVERPVPIAAYAAAPVVRIGSTLTSVSTLFADGRLAEQALLHGERRLASAARRGSPRWS